MHNRQDEARLQELVCRWMDSKGIMYIASMMGVNLGARVGAIRKRMGCKAGQPDLFVLEPRGRYHGMFLELKIKGGKVTEEQKEFRNQAEEKGYFSIILLPIWELGEAFENAKIVMQGYIDRGGETKL